MGHINQTDSPVVSGDFTLKKKTMLSKRAGGKEKKTSTECSDEWFNAKNYQVSALAGFLCYDECKWGE